MSRRVEHAPGPPDAAASLSLAVVAVLALALAWFLPWWAMEARAPQYGQRVLVVEVSPNRVTGDVFEVDTLGHYVGIQPIASLAPVERRLAPLGLAAALAGLLAAPWLRRRAWRAAAVLPALAMPLLFLADLDYWMDRSMSERDLESALNLTVTSIEPRLLGDYAVGQFQVTAKAEAGLYLAAVAALLGLGLALARPLPLPGGGVRAGSAAVRPAALALLALAAAAEGAERRVAPGEPLAEALAAARPGDTLRLAAGTWTGNFVVDRALRLEGEAGATLDGGGAGTVLAVRAPGVTLRGLTLRGSGTSYTVEDAGLRLEGADGARLTALRVEDALFGIWIAKSPGVVLEDSVVVGKDLPPERRGDGIRLWYSNGCALVRNRVERTRDVIIWYSSGTRVEDNEVVDGRYGLHYMYSDDNTFRGNRFDRNQVGATVMYSRGIELARNSFSWSRGAGGYGLLVKESNDVLVLENRFVGNATALFLDDSPQARDARAEVRGNLIAGNDLGIALQPLTRRVVFAANTLAGNRAQVAVQGTGSAEGCAWSDGGRGNHWDDAVVYDRDGDGVSELPFRIESTYEGLAQRHPALAFYAGTPAAEAIDLAARLFPVFAPRPVLADPHPLAAPADSALPAAPAGAAPRAPLGVAGAAMTAVAGLGCAAALRGLA